jgi:arsenate reductase
MAAGFLRHLAGNEIRVLSGGSQPAQSLNEAAVFVMSEAGIDIASQVPRLTDTHLVREADVVVTMGCGDSCPILPGKRYEDWPLADPAGQPIEIVRGIRDEIRQRVERLIEELRAG